MVVVHATNLVPAPHVVAQLAHDALPSLVCTQPPGQFRHDVLPWSCLPAAHLPQLVLALFGCTHPPGHPLHALPVEYAPALHRVQLVVPPPLAHPEGQFRHELLPWSCWPRGHALQLLLPEPGCTHPLGQFRHDSPLPWSCWPAGQS